MHEGLVTGEVGVILGQLVVELQLLKPLPGGSMGAHHIDIAADLNGLLHRILDRQGGGETQMHHLAEIENHSIAVADGVVLPVDRLGHPENHGAIELKQQNATTGLVEQLTFVIGKIGILIPGADRFDALGLHGAHLVDGDDVGHEDAHTHSHHQVDQNGESDHHVSDHHALA